MKQTIKRGLLGLAIVPLVALGVSVFGADVTSATDLTLSGGAQASKGEQVAESLFDPGGVFQTVANILLFLIGAISVIMLIIGGIRYVVSGGDQAAVTSAKNTILYAIVGIVVAFLAFAAVDFVINSLVNA